MTPDAEGGEEEASVVYAVRLTDRARRDVEDAIERLTQIAGERVADEWEDGLYAALATLATLPRRQVIAPESSLFRTIGPVRQLVYRRRRGGPAWRALFTVAEGGADAPAVNVVHIRHAAQRPITRAEAREIEAQQP